MRKDYDQITVNENWFNRQAAQTAEFKAIKQQFKKIVEVNFLSVFPGAREKINAARHAKTKAKR